MADALAAAEVQLCASAAHRCRSLRVSRLWTHGGDRRRNAGPPARRPDMTELSHAVHEPWPDLRLQREGVGLGMWIFLASEVLFFGALFCSYAVYRSFNADAF